MTLFAAGASLCQPLTALRTCARALAGLWLLGLAAAQDRSWVTVAPGGDTACGYGASTHSTCAHRNRAPDRHGVSGGGEHA